MHPLAAFNLYLRYDGIRPMADVSFFGCENALVTNQAHIVLPGHEF